MEIKPHDPLKGNNFFRKNSHLTYFTLQVLSGDSSNRGSTKNKLRPLVLRFTHLRVLAAVYRGDI